MAHVRDSAEVGIPLRFFFHVRSGTGAGGPHNSPSLSSFDVLKKKSEKVLNGPQSQIEIIEVPELMTETLTTQ
jgi:hypothetical protein